MSKVSNDDVVRFISTYLLNNALPTGQELTDVVNEEFGTEYSKQSVSGLMSNTRTKFNELCDNMLTKGKDREMVEKVRGQLLAKMPELKRGRAGGNGSSFVNEEAASILEGLANLS